MGLTTLQIISQNFTNELISSAKGEKTSLAFIKNTIPSSPIVQDGEMFQVMVIGGTNFINAFLAKKDGNITINKIEEDKLPLLETKEIFFSFIEGYLDPKTTVLALNFAYPLLPVFEMGRLDGTILYTSKEHQFTGLIGKKICATFQEYIAEKRNQKITVSAANDTICLLSSGLTQHTAQGLAAGIIGSGINFAIFLDDTTLINLEAGAFNKFPRSKAGIAIDNASTQKGINIFEKEIGGKFLGQYYNLLAEENGLSLKITSAEELDTRARSDDKIAQQVLEHSAQLVASVVAGIMEFKQSDMTFVMQGSVFWKGYQYKEIVAKTVKQLTSYSVDFIRVEHADILGAAKLVA